MSDMTPRERAREIATLWSGASKAEKWSGAPGDVHNMLEAMIDGFYEAERELAAKEAQLAEAKIVIWAVATTIDQALLLDDHLALGWDDLHGAVQAARAFLAAHPETEKK